MTNIIWRIFKLIFNQFDLFCIANLIWKIINQIGGVDIQKGGMEDELEIISNLKSVVTDIFNKKLKKIFFFFFLAKIIPPIFFYFEKMISVDFANQSFDSHRNGRLFFCNFDIRSNDSPLSFSKHKLDHIGQRCQNE